VLHRERLQLMAARRYSDERLHQYNTSRRGF